MRANGICKRIRRWKAWAVAAKPLSQAPELHPRGWKAGARAMGIMLLEGFPGVLLFCGGVVICLDWICHRRGAGFIFLVVVMALLLVVTAMKNYTWRQLIEIRGKLIEVLEADRTGLREENRKLKKVALAAVALTINVEHGVPPDLTVLKRELAAFQPEEETHEQKEKAGG